MSMISVVNNEAISHHDTALRARTTFPDQFNDYAITIADNANNRALTAVTAVATFGNSITAFAISSGAEWPNITVPHFELRGETNNHLSGAIQITLAPLVSSSRKPGWETYAMAHQSWLAESLRLREEMSDTARRLVNKDKEDTVDNDGNTVVSPITNEVWHHNNTKGLIGDDGSTALYAPVWQQSPAPTRDTSVVNFDLLSVPVFQMAYRALWETEKPVIFAASDSGSLLEDSGAVDGDYMQKNQTHSFLMSLVHPFFAPEHRFGDAVGLLVAVLPWDTYFVDIFPEGFSGIVVVLWDRCGVDHLTYLINGPDAIFLGKGDLHDTEFDNTMVAADFAPFLSPNQQLCQYELRIYPSVELEDENQTNQPIVFTISVVLVFFLTAMVFVLYDYLVQVRENQVVVTHTRTSAIVSSLFPSNVRDRILQDAKEQAEQELMKNGKRGSLMALRTNFHDDRTETDGIQAFSTKPIADLFPETTVLFAGKWSYGRFSVRAEYPDIVGCVRVLTHILLLLATNPDIVGFTAWSSIREPSQVFQLLETIYHGKSGMPSSCFV